MYGLSTSLRGSWPLPRPDVLFLSTELCTRQHDVPDRYGTMAEVVELDGLRRGRSQSLRAGEHRLI